MNSFGVKGVLLGKTSDNIDPDEGFNNAKRSSTLGMVTNFKSSTDCGCF